MTEQELLQLNYKNGGNNYVLLGNTKWIAFTRNVIENKLIRKFGNNFNLIVYWKDDLIDNNINFICIPFSKISHLLIEDHLTGRYTKHERWNFIIKDNLFCVHANTNYSIDITPYLNLLTTPNQDRLSDDIFGAEGDVKYAIHKSIERNPVLIQKIKLKRESEDSNLHCEVCGFSFFDKYGEIGKGFIEAHHILPLSTLSNTTITTEKDLILVCSNCHRMLHRTNPVMNHIELKKRIDSSVNK